MRRAVAALVQMHTAGAQTVGAIVTELKYRVDLENFDRLAAKGGAAGAGLAPVAGAGDVEEIGAARPLHHIAARRRGVAQLRRGAREQGLRDGGEAPREFGMMREIGVANERADARASVGPRPGNVVGM